MTTQSALTKRIKMKALELGFSSVGITSCEDFTEYAAELRSRDDYATWNNENAALYKGCFPSEFFPEGKSIICAVYGFGDIDFPEELTRHVGRTYLARCYTPTAESMAGRRVQALKDYLTSIGVTVYEGTEAEIPARPACARAGVITYGKNNFARTEEHGTFIILYTLAVDAELDCDEPTIESPCPEGCTLCIDACPTKAIIEPGRLHPQNCILLNNLHPDWKPELRDQLDQRIHGCDVCQEVCPRNHEVLKNASRKDMFLEQLVEDFDLEKILLLDDDYYNTVLQPIMYNYIRDMNVFRINAAIAMGNSGNEEYIPALQNALTQGLDENVNEAIEWALAKLR